MKQFLARQYARIPQPTRTIATLLAFALGVLILFHYADLALRAIDGALFRREVAPITLQVETKQADAAAHEQAADAAAADYAELERRYAEMERRITTDSKRREHARARTEKSRRTVHAIRQAPADLRRPVDDLRLRELRAVLQSQYPELVGEGHDGSKPAKQ